MKSPNTESKDFELERKVMYRYMRNIENFQHLDTIRY